MKMHLRAWPGVRRARRFTASSLCCSACHLYAFAPIPHASTTNKHAPATAKAFVE
jgi:hypothetical protein